MAVTSIIKRINTLRIYTGILFFLFFSTTYVTSMMMVQPQPPKNDQSTTTSTSTVANAARELQLFSHTPMIRSDRISNIIGRDVYFKLDSMQQSGSFKDRGMAHLCQTLKDTQGTTKLISSSGGNAGLAAATIGRALQMTVHVIVPQTTKSFVIDKLTSLGATVTVHGENWNAADLLARQLVEQDPLAAYISPYDNPLLWTGHSTIIDEIYNDLSSITPAIVVASVGGGGLLCGIFEGLERNAIMKKEEKTIVVAAETQGAASFGQSFQKGKLIRLDTIDSIATSLGALQVTPVALERASIHQTKWGMDSVRIAICSDAEAVDACDQFYNDHGILVEPACGAALAVVYVERVRTATLHDILQASSSSSSSLDGPIVVEVCGGSGVSIELLAQWKKEFLE